MPHWTDALPPPKLFATDGDLSEGAMGVENIRWVYPFPRHWPLYVNRSGNAVWREGNFWRRKNSQFCSIEIITRGNMRFIQNRREYLVEPGHAFILQRGGSHVYTAGPAGFACKRFAGLHGPALASLLALTGLDHVDVFEVRDLTAVIRLIKSCQRLLEVKPPGFEKGISINAYAIIAEVLASSVAQKSIPTQRALEIMQNNLEDPVSNRDLAQQVGVSPAFLVRQFRQQTGQTPHRYHLQMRIAAAQHLLHATDLQVKEIAVRTGFEDPLYFSRIFRKITGRNPRSYRRGSAMG